LFLIVVGESHVADLARKIGAFSHPTPEGRPEPMDGNLQLHSPERHEKYHVGHWLGWRPAGEGEFTIKTDRTFVRRRISMQQGESGSRYWRSAFMRSAGMV
jgi:hypothetical protein